MSARPQKAPANIEVVPTYDQLCDAGAMRILAAAHQAIGARGRFTVALSGGSTPRGVYERLATAPLAATTDWTGWHFFWGDERWVSPRHRHSNYHMACSTMLDHVPLVPIQVHPMVPVGCEPRVSDRSPWHELEDVAAAARAYEATLLHELEIPGVPDQSLAGASCRPPRLDLVLLGLGDDGHTASLFPGSTAVEEQHRWVVATPAPSGAEERELARLTLTLPLLNAAREAVFLVSGAAKSATVAAVLRKGGGSSSASSPQPLPAARVLPARGQLTWLLDAGAASELSPGA